MSSINKTPILNLPQYQGTDTFDLSEINEAYNKIDYAYDVASKVPQTNATVEVIDARGGLPTLGEKVRKLSSDLDTCAKKDEVANGLTAKGNSLYSALPTSGNKIGDYYYCSDGDGINGAGNYVWNGTTWYFGGTGDEGYNVVNNKFNLFSQASFTTVTGGYIKHADGGVSSYASLNYCDYVFVLPLSTVSIDLNGMTLNTADARGLAFYDKDKKYISGVQYQGGGVIQNINIVVPSNAYYLRFTFKNTPKLYVTPPAQVLIEILTENLYKEFDYTDIIKNNHYKGGYINSSTGNIGLYGDNIFYTNYIPCEEGDILDLKNISTYSDTRGLSFYDQNKTYISGVRYENTNISITVPSGAKFFIMTLADTFIDTFTIKCITKNSATLVLRKVEFINPIEYKGNEVNIFTRCACIGDSLTRGVFNDNSTGTTQYVAIEKYGYPKRLQDLTGIECVNLGQGGHTTKSWYELYQNKDLTGCDMAIINLGANDTVANSMTPELSETYLQKIVDKLKASNKGIKIFIATILPAYYTRNTTLYYGINSKIKSVVTNNENCYLIDLTLYSQCKENTVYSQGHLTALGYNKEANELKSMISYVIKNNINDFKYVHFINSDYSFS